MPRSQGQNLRRELELADSPFLNSFANPNSQHHTFVHIENGKKKAVFIVNHGTVRGSIRSVRALAGFWYLPLVAVWAL